MQLSGYQTMVAILLAYRIDTAWRGLLDKVHGNGLLGSVSVVFMICHAMVLNFNSFRVSLVPKGPGYEATATPVQQRLSLRLTPNRPCMTLVNLCQYGRGRQSLPWDKRFTDKYFTNETRR